MTYRVERNHPIEISNIDNNNDATITMERE